MGFHGSGKGDFHCYFLADEKALAGFDKCTAGTDITNCCPKIAIPGLAMCGRQDLGEPFPTGISFLDISCSLFSDKKNAHFKEQLFLPVTFGQLVRFNK
jgi:hypothetical protein